jgi:hypothetical protein
VDSILVLLGLIIKITIMGFFTFVVLHVLRGLKKRGLREEIGRIEAKMATYRMSLRNRVKKKAKRFRTTYPKSITPGEPIDLNITQLSELSFEKNSDFQDYIELSKKINTFIDLANIDKSESAKLKEANQCDFMGVDFKNELSIVRTINDLVSVSKTLHKQTTRYNHFDRRARLQVFEPINFPSLYELQKVFKSEEAGDNSFEKPHPETKAA